MSLAGPLASAMVATVHLAAPHAAIDTGRGTSASDEEIRELVSAQISPLIEADRFPGCSVGVLKDGEAHTFGFGGTNADGSGDLPDEHTLYEIGSITKVFTAVLLADAAQRGEVTLETPIADLLPDGLPAPQFEDDPIRLWHLATHSSGLPGMPTNFAPENPATPFAGYSLDLLYEFLAIAQPVRAPEASYEYSNLASGLLGRLLERHLDSGYDELVGSRLFGPAGMAESYVVTDNAAEERIAQPSAEGLSASRWKDMDALAPCGVIVSSVSDLLRFASENIAPSAPESSFARALDASHDPLFEDPRSGTVVALGWHLAGDGETLWHNGMTGGYSSMLLVNVPNRMAVVVLANGASPDTTAVGDRIMRSLLGGDAPAPPIEAAADVSAEHLERLVGDYRSPLGFMIHVTREGDRLGARLTGQTRFRVYPDDTGDPPARFRYRVVPAALEFEIPETGSATAVTLEQNGRRMRAERADD